MPGEPAPGADPDRESEPITVEEAGVRGRVADEVRGWLKSLFFALVLVLIFRAHVAEGYQIKGASMTPSLKNADRLFVEKMTRHFRPYRGGDIVVFPHPREGKKLIKRVVATGGQKVRIQNGQLWVDGVPLTESYVHEENRDNASSTETTVPPGKLFVLGDNRAQSNDSRNEAQVGFVPEEAVVGRAFFRFWPLDRLKIFP